MAKTKINKNKVNGIEFEDAFGEIHRFNADELWRADLTNDKGGIYYRLRLFDKSDRLICEAPVTYELWQELDLRRIIEKHRGLEPKKHREANTMKTIIKMDDGLTQYEVLDDIALDLIKSKELYAKVDESELGEIFVNKNHILSIQQKNEYSDNEGGLKTFDQIAEELKNDK